MIVICVETESHTKVAKLFGLSLVRRFRHCVWTESRTKVAKFVFGLSLVRRLRNLCSD